MKQVLKAGSSLFSLLGITSGFGAISNGNDPSKSFTMAGAFFVALLLLNLPTKAKKNN
jgi:hypothetical protein